MEYQTDQHLKDILSGSAGKMPFQDFEDELIERITEQQFKHNAVLKDLKRSWVFFICGLLSGILILIVPFFIKDIALTHTLESYLGPAVVITICCILLLFTEKLIKVTFNHR